MNIVFFNDSYFHKSLLIIFILKFLWQPKALVNNNSLLTLIFMIRNVFHKYVSVESINVHLKILRELLSSNNQFFRKMLWENANVNVKNSKRNVIVNVKVSIKVTNMFTNRDTMIHSQFKQYTKRISKENMYNKIN